MKDILSVCKKWQNQYIRKSSWARSEIEKYQFYIYPFFLLLTPLFTSLQKLDNTTPRPPVLGSVTDGGKQLQHNMKKFM